MAKKKAAKANKVNKGTKQRSRRSSVPLSAFGERLSPLLQAAGKTPQQFAAELGIHATTIWRWMRQSSGPRSTDISAMASRLGVSADQLLGQDKPTKKSPKKAASAIA